MDFEYRKKLPIDFADDSRVWIYQASRIFTPEETLQIEERLYAFTSKWQSHGVPVKGYGIIFFGQFIILMADERASGVSGCSTDSSVRLVKQIELDFNVLLFDRQLLAFIIQDSVKLIPLAKISDELENAGLQPESLYFNNTVQTKEELENRWIIPLTESWLSNQISRLHPSLNAEVAHLVERQLPKL